MASFIHWHFGVHHENAVLGKRQRRTLDAVLNGQSDANVAYADLLNLLQALGFSRRVRGGHYVFWKAGIVEIVNLQPHGAKAKPYQVRQVRKILMKYELGDRNDQPV